MIPPPTLGMFHLAYAMYVENKPEGEDYARRTSTIYVAAIFGILVLIGEMAVQALIAGHSPSNFGRVNGTEFQTVLAPYGVIAISALLSWWSWGRRVRFALHVARFACRPPPPLALAIFAAPALAGCMWLTYQNTVVGLAVTTAIIFGLSALSAQRLAAATGAGVSDGQDPYDEA